CRRAGGLVGGGGVVVRGSQIRRLLGNEIVGEVVGGGGEAGVGTVDRGAAAEQVISDARHVALVVGDAGDLVHRVVDVGGVEDGGAAVVGLLDRGGRRAGL